MAENKKYKSDIEIAREANLNNIVDIAEKKLNISEKFLEQYGHHKAKISFDYIKMYDVNSYLKYDKMLECIWNNPKTNEKGFE